MKYTPRLTAPSKSDKNFIHYSKGGYNTCIMIDKSTGSVLPNCVGYAQGRLLEILGKKAVNWKLPACNAEDWFETAQNNGFKTGQTPKLGAIAVFRAGTTHNGSDGAGHVAVVEEIKSNGDIVVSQSAYGGTEFYLSTITKASGYMYNSNRPFLGFIYCGIEFEQPIPASENIVAGKKVALNNTPCYSSETAKEAYGTKTGSFYLWDNVVRNGRIRITNAVSRVGVAGQVTCWINIDDVSLSASATTTTSKPQPVLKSVDEVAREVIAGKWGNGADRKARLTQAGYDYSAVQARVNQLLK